MAAFEPECTSFVVSGRKSGGTFEFKLPPTMDLTQGLWEACIGSMALDFQEDYAGAACVSMSVTKSFQKCEGEFEWMLENCPQELVMCNKKAQHWSFGQRWQVVTAPACELTITLTDPFTKAPLKPRCKAAFIIWFRRVLGSKN